MAEDLHVEWIKCKSGNYCDFWIIDLSSTYFDEQRIGIYLIWYGKEMLYVGQGDIAARIQAHRNEREFLAYKDKKLTVTFAEVEKRFLDGVEHYLAEVYHPTIGDAHPSATPISVNPI